MSRQTFTVTEEHVKLLRNAIVRWEDCEYGAPAIDCKRPYGNSGVVHDIFEILGWEPSDDEWDWTREEKERAYKIHKETEIALRIFLNVGRLGTGTFVSNDYGYEWEPLVG